LSLIFRQITASFIILRGGLTKRLPTEKGNRYGFPALRAHFLMARALIQKGRCDEGIDEA